MATEICPEGHSLVTERDETTANDVTDFVTAVTIALACLPVGAAEKLGVTIEQAG